MLLRTVMFVPSALARRLQRLLAEEPVRFVAAGRSLGKVLASGDAELLLVDQARLLAASEAQLARIQAADGPDAIVFSSDDDPVVRARLQAAGALGVLSCTLGDSALGEALRALVARCRTAAMQRLRAERSAPAVSLEDFVSQSEEMQRLVAVARRMVDSDATVLVSGETGVGKERLARAIHDEGARRSGPFVAVNCGALPEALLESELFGHEEGAFTGAVRAHRGLFELAHGGTLFLDEVAEMPLLLQVKLLRVLQERAIRPVGGERDLCVDVRVIAASNRDLQAEVRAQRFRIDLYYRLAVVAVLIPPLRRRRADIPELVRNHLEGICVRLNCRPMAVTAEAMAAMVAHEWPGNVRELANVLERAVLLGDGAMVTVWDLSGIAERGRPLLPPSGSAALPSVSYVADLARVVAEFDRTYFAALLERCNGRIGAAAREAGLSPRTLYNKCKRLGLEKLEFRVASGAKT